jgi:hypothetical protein
MDARRGLVRSLGSAAVDDFGVKYEPRNGANAARQGKKRGEGHVPTSAEKLSN